MFSLLSCFVHYTIYECIGEHVAPAERLPLLLRLRLVSKEFKDVILNWDLWWCWWKMHTAPIDDYTPMNRFMCRLAMRYIDGAGNVAVDALRYYRNFDAARIRTLYRSVRGHSFYHLTSFRRVPEHLYCAFFILLADQMLTSIHHLPYIPPPYIDHFRERSKIKHAFSSVQQKQNIVAIFRFCKMLVWRMTRFYSFAQHDKHRLTCAIKFLERAPVLGGAGGASQLQNQFLFDIQ